MIFVVSQLFKTLVVYALHTSESLTVHKLRLFVLPNFPPPRPPVCRVFGFCLLSLVSLSCLTSPISGLSSLNLHPPSLISHLSTPILRLSSLNLYPPSSISCLPSPVSCLLSPVSCLPSLISHLPSLVSRLLTEFRVC